MKRSGAFASYAQSFAWVVGLVAAVFAVGNITAVIGADFIHTNPYRPLSNSIDMIVVLSPIIMLIVGGASLITFFVPQCLEALWAGQLTQRLGDRARFLVLLAVPLTAVLTWYCYDYFLPEISLGIYDGPDWVPYQHGLTPSRYAKALAVQTPLSLFNILYFDSVGRSRYRKIVLLIALAAVVVVGAAQGWPSASE